MQIDEIFQEIRTERTVAISLVAESYAEEVLLHELITAFLDPSKLITIEDVDNEPAYPKIFSSDEPGGPLELSILN